jgi:hypothetical protein
LEKLFPVEFIKAAVDWGVVFINAKQMGQIVVQVRMKI